MPSGICKPSTSQGSGNGHFSNPVGIIIHDGKFYIGNYNNHRISVFQLDGQFSHIIGSGHLKYPYYIAVSSIIIYNAYPTLVHV